MTTAKPARRTEFLSLEEQSADYRTLLERSSDDSTEATFSKLCVIAIAPRVGSTLFCRLLEAQGAATRIDEVLNARGPTGGPFRRNMKKTGSPETVMGYLNALHAEFMPGDTLIIKCSYVDFHPLLKIPGLQLTHSNCQVVALRRRDKVKQALSLVRASESGTFHRAADGKEFPRHGAQPKGDVSRGNSVDYRERVSQALSRILRQEYLWDLWAKRSGVDPLPLYYEDLVTNPKSTLSTFANWARITRDSDDVSSMPLKKVSGDEDEQICAELKDWLTGVLQ